MRHPNLQSDRPHAFEVLIGIALIVLGGATILGWLLHLPALLEIRPGMVPMVFGSGLCFLLTGITVIAASWPGRTSLLLRRVIAVSLILLCSAALYEHVFDVRLGVDFASLHAWHDYDNTRPGRMAPNSATGFILFGAASFLMTKVRSYRRGLAVGVLIFSLLAVGLTGLVGYLLAPDLLFNWARSARMALQTATGMILCAFALWLACSRSDWYLSERFFREDGKIRFLSAAISIMSTITIGLAGFVLLQGNLEQALESRLEAIIYNRGPWFAAMSNETMQHVASAVRLSALDQYSGALLVDAQDARARERLAASAAQLLRNDVRGVIVTDSAQRLLYAAGRFTAVPAISAPLDASGSAALIWDDVLILRVRLPVVEAGQLRGSIVVDHVLPALGAPLFHIAKMSNSAEVAVCVARGTQLLCFPNVKNVAPFTVAMRGNTGSPLPMELALAGRRGVVYGVDYRGRNVLAAYGQLAPGLGMVAKQDTAEAYAGIRASLRVGAPLIISVSLLGAMFLFSQLNPLISKIRASESAAADAVVEMATIMEAAGDGIVTIDQHGNIESINMAARRIFGRQHEDVIGRHIALLIPSMLHAAQLQALSAAAKAALPGSPDSKADGIRQNGALFPLEISIRAVQLAGRTLFVGVVRDITVRRDSEDRLSRLAQYDTLTGLPNRALFMDRLGTALSRATRNPAVFALLFLDLDGFKAINDTYGHGGGDALLKQVADLLAASVRHSDTVARLAGDEFTIILEDLAEPEASAIAVAETIIAALRAPFLIAGQAVQITASIGITLHDPSVSDASIADLMRCADNEMYIVKRAGKNAFRLGTLHVAPQPC
ncbi:MAG: diguanylate cyclase [Pseudomonadota bacterium]|nr:diguanylate cyclase [Pseudomonadota bacterium]